MSYPRQIVIDTNSTLEELDGEDWGEPSNDDTGLVKRCLRLRRTPLKQFSPADLRVMLNQRFCVDQLYPLALPFLQEHPGLDAEFYPGDLLETLLRRQIFFPLEVKDTQVI